MPRSSGSSRSRSSRPRRRGHRTGAPLGRIARGVQPKGAPHPADRALAEPPTGARRSSWSTDPLFITASGGDRQRITETIWWDHHEGSHSAEALRLGKQTLCQLSYSRSGGPDCSGPPSRRQRAARAIRPRPGLAVARAYDGQHGCAARTVSPTGVSPPGDPHRTCQTRLIATRRTGALWARCPHRER